MDSKKPFRWDLRENFPHKYGSDDIRDTLIDDYAFPKQFQRMLGAFKAHLTSLGNELTERYAEKLDEMEVTFDMDEFLEVVWFCSMEYTSYKYKIYNDWLVKHPPCKITGSSSVLTGGGYVYALDPVPTYSVFGDDTEPKSEIDDLEIPVVRMLDFLSRSFVYDQDIDVYRGETEKNVDLRSPVDLNQTFVRNKGKGDIVRIPKFVSTSMNYQIPSNFLDKQGTCCYYKIKVPKGTPFFPTIFASTVNEYEILLPPCNDYVITDRSGGVIQLTVLGNSGDGYYGKLGTKSFNEDLFLKDLRTLCYNKDSIPSWQKDYMFGTTRNKLIALEKYYTEGGIISGGRARRRRTKSTIKRTQRKKRSKATTRRKTRSKKRKTKSSMKRRTKKKH